MTYLVRDKNGTYYFRKVIPPKLRQHMPAPWTGKANFKRSLETKNPRGAKIKASRVFSDCTTAFQIAERALTSDHSKVVHREAQSVGLSFEQVERDVITEILKQRR